MKVIPQGTSEPLKAIDRLSFGHISISILVRKMKRTALLAAVAVLCTVSPSFAEELGAKGGWWPKNWPKELEPLRKQAWTWDFDSLLKPDDGITTYEMSFANREEFEAAWPHILKVKGKNVPITLLRGAHVRVWTTWPPQNKTAGVRIPTRNSIDRKNAVVVTADFDRTAFGTFATSATVKGIQLVVDGEIVDLNRIRLPADTPIIDKRFDDK